MIIDAAEQRMVVVSDLHLGNPSSRAASTFPAFLDYVRRERFALCINGDGFEMLQTRASLLIRDALPLLAQIGRMDREGLRVYYVVGNHDIYAEHLLDELLVTAVCPFLNLTSGGRRIRIEHGHLYDACFARWPVFYQAVTRLSGRVLLRSLDIYRLWDAVEQRVDQRLRRRESDRGDVPPYHRVAAEVLGRGFDTVIYGHTHRAESVQLTGGLYLNTGTWVKGGSYVEIDGGHAELKQWAA